MSINSLFTVVITNVNTLSNCYKNKSQTMYGIKNRVGLWFVFIIWRMRTLQHTRNSFSAAVAHSVMYQMPSIMCTSAVIMLSEQTHDGICFEFYSQSEIKHVDEFSVRRFICDKWLRSFPVFHVTLAQMMLYNSYHYHYHYQLRLNGFLSLVVKTVSVW